MRPPAAPGPARRLRDRGPALPHRPEVPGHRDQLCPGGPEEDQAAAGDSDEERGERREEHQDYGSPETGATQSQWLLMRLVTETLKKKKKTCL